MGIEETLKRTEVFLGLDDNDLAKIAALPSCQEVSYAEGEFIIKAGDAARYLYVLKEGQVDVVMDVPPDSKEDTFKVVVDVITKGGFFGWSALVKPHSYVMSAISSKPSIVAIINGAEIMALFDREYYIGYKVFESLSHIIGNRLRDLEQVVVRGKRWPFLRSGKLSDI